MREGVTERLLWLGLETDDADLPEKPPVDSLDASNAVWIDLGILNYIYTSDNDCSHYVPVRATPVGGPHR